MANLVLGPLLRHVDVTTATVWVETDAPCEVAVLDGRARTFRVEGHHYALVVVPGLEPGVARPYEVALDGRRVWPEEGSAFPPSTIRPPRPDEPLKLIFGSCRVTGPHEVLPTSARGFSSRSQDVDALRAFGLRMGRTPRERWPDALLLLGDQVYADEVSPETGAFIARRGRRNGAPADEVADFEEYTRLYREAWSEPVVRWVLSTLPTAMVFDDHDVHDDWNTSAAWVATMRRKPWWRERIVGGLMSYWLYQHLGNLAPTELAAHERYQAILAAGDGTAILREFAAYADRETRGVRWSYTRDVGRTRLVVMDSRCGRVLDGIAHRRMVDDEELDWIAEQTRADVDHLLLATTLPVLLPRALHDLEAWDEAISAGRWGAAAARAGEWIRQKVDLEHWAAFQHSFVRLAGLVRDAAGGRSGVAPASILMLSGDVHHAYVAAVRDLPGVYQLVSSPLRHPMPRLMQWVYRAMVSPPARRLTGWLARRAGVADPPISWEIEQGPWFDNQIATLEVSGRHITFRLERSLLDDDGEPSLDLLMQRALT